MPFPATWEGSMNYSYVTHGYLTVFFSVALGFFLAIILNIYLITKWKVLLKGRYFWLRSIRSSGISEFIYSTITGFIIFYGNVQNKELFSYILGMCVLKWLGTIVFATPATILTNVLKKIENIENKNKYSNIFKESNGH